MNELEKLKAENERLKREYDILDGIIDVNNAKIGQLEKEIKELSHYLACMTEQRNKLDTCLQEIKEIAERQMRCCTCKLDDYKSGCKECESKYAREIAVEILQKISEVE